MVFPGAGDPPPRFHVWSEAQSFVQSVWAITTLSQASTVSGVGFIGVGGETLVYRGINHSLPGGKPLVYQWVNHGIPGGEPLVYRGINHGVYGGENPWSTGG